MLLLCVYSIAWAHSTPQVRHIKTQISQLKNTLKKDLHQQIQLSKKIERTDILIGHATKDLHYTRILLHRQQKKLSKLTQTKIRYQTKLAQQQQALAQQVKASYILGRQQYLKMLLNQQNPNLVSRMLTYYHYIIQHRVDLITNINQMLVKINRTKLAIAQHTQALRKLRKRQQQTQHRLKTEKYRRSKLLAKTNHEIISKQQKLVTLVRNKRALEKVLSQLELKGVFTKYIQFGKLRGKLHYPTKGRIITPFHTQVDSSQILLNGIIIKAPEGQNIYAIAPGRVIFSKWMSNYGLLLIVDHGHGYMTIYGRNDGLFVQKGEYVGTGTLIAKVGSSGGHRKSALYFAIRRNGKPLDPSRWLASR